MNKIIILFGLLLLTGCSAGQVGHILYEPMNPDRIIYSKTSNITQDFNVSFIDVGQGDSILFQNNGYIVLIDCGPDNKAFDYLKKIGITKIDLLIITHPHADHLAGCIPILKTIKVLDVLDNGEMAKTKIYQEYSNILKSIPKRAARTDDIFTFGKMKIMVIHSDMNSSNVNDNSVVVKATFGNISFMMTGDCEKDCENEILNDSYSLYSQVLKAGHHGSRTATSPDFLNEVQPLIAVISAGINNTYGHPHQETLDMLKVMNIKIERTDKSGTIMFMGADGKLVKLIE